MRGEEDDTCCIDCFVSLDALYSQCCIRDLMLRLVAFGTESGRFMFRNCKPRIECDTRTRWYIPNPGTYSLSENIGGEAVLEISS